LFLQLVKMPRRYKNVFLQKTAELEEPGVYCQELAEPDSFAYFFIVFHEKQEEKIREELGTVEAQIVGLGEEDQTPAELLAELRREEEELQRKREQLQQEIAGLVTWRPMLQALYDDKANRL